MEMLRRRNANRRTAVSQLYKGDGKELQNRKKQEFARQFSETGEKIHNLIEPQRPNYQGLQKKSSGGGDASHRRNSGEALGWPAPSQDRPVGAAPLFDGQGQLAPVFSRGEEKIHKTIGDRSKNKSERSQNEG